MGNQSNPDKVVWLGMITSLKPVHNEKMPFRTSAEAWVISQSLKQHHAKLICYDYDDINYEDETVNGYVYDAGEFIRKRTPMPVVNFDFNFISGSQEKSKKRTEFESWALKKDYIITSPPKLRQLACDKIDSAKVLTKWDPTLNPKTERYLGKIQQIENYLKDHEQVYIKPIYGNRGQNIYVITNKKDYYHVALYCDAKLTIQESKDLCGIVEFIQQQTEGKPYLIQEAIEGVTYQGSVHSIRLILYFNGTTWDFVGRFFLGKPDTAVSSEDQGGKHYDIAEMMPKVFPGAEGEKLLTTLKTHAVDLADYLDKAGYGPINDLAVDYIIDKNNNITIGEINVKPGLAGDNIPYKELEEMTEAEKQKHQTRFYHGACIANSLLALYHYQQDVSSYWLDDIDSYVVLNWDMAQQICSNVFYAVKNRRFYIAALPIGTPVDNQLRMVFISATDQTAKGICGWGIGFGILHAINIALAKLKATLADFQVKGVKCDFVKEIHSYSDDISGPVHFDRSLEGFAFDKECGLAFIPGQTIADNLIDNQNRIKINRIIKRYAGTTEQKQRLGLLQRVKLYHYQTQSFYYSESTFDQIYREHFIYRKVNADILRHAIKLSGNYLLNCIDESGRFIYEYLPKRDKVSKRYNILRHAGSIYALLEYYEIHKQPMLLTSCQSALDYLLSYAQTVIINDEKMLSIVEKDFSKLGGNALAILALSKYIAITGNKTYLDAAKMLGKWIKAHQSESGAFTAHKIQFSTQVPTDFVSDYYPGESIFALVRLYDVDQDLNWLQMAKSAAKYIIEVRDKGKSVRTLNHDHWLLYGLNALYQHDPDPLYQAHANKICQAIMKAQYRQNKPLDYMGSFYNPPRSTPTAIRAEGLCAAYQILSGYLSKKALDEIEAAITLCIGFQLQNQFFPERTLYLSHPQAALGGVSKSLTDYSIRIDYVQHHLSSIIGLYQLKYNEKKEN